MNKSLVLQPQPRGRHERELPGACGTDPALFWLAVGYSIRAGTAGSGWSVAHLQSLQDGHNPNTPPPSSSQQQLPEGFPKLLLSPQFP